MVKPPRAAALVPVAIVSLCSKPGLPQVAVEVDESGAYDQPGSVQDLGVFLLYAFLDAENLAVLDDHVGDPVDSL